MRAVQRPSTLRTLGGAALAAALTASSAAHAQQRVYLGNDDHTDYFWTGTDVTYRAAFLAMLDYYLDQIDRTATNPSDFRGRFTCDNNLWVWEYERNRSPAQFARLVSRLRDGSITMSMQSLVPLYGAMPTEAVLRDLYYAGRLERRYGLDFSVVQAMENMTLPGGVASLWAGAGARYSWRGVCGCATRTLGGARQREIYNFVGPDGRGVVMKWNTSNGNESLGGYAEARHPDDAVTYMTSDPGFRARWPYDVMGAFGYGHDDLQTMTDAMITTAMARSTPTRRVIVSNETDFFEDFTRSYGATIPTFTGSHGNEWDLLTASLADVSARMRRAVERLRAAEAIATVVSLRDPSLLAGRADARDLAFMRMGMYFDHDWTADTPMGRAPREGFQRDSAARVEAYVSALHDDALARLATMISAPSSSAERYVVFNPLGWTRTDAVDLPSTTAGPLHVVDLASGVEVPSQVVSVGGVSRVRVLARDVPGVGYGVFEVRAGAGNAFPQAASVSGSTLDSGRYRVTVGADGSITSLLDHRASDRDLVRAGAALNRLTGSSSGAVTTESSGAVSATLRVTAGGSPAHTTRVTVYSGVDRVDVENRITQNFGATSGYQFDLRATSYAIRHEEVGMIARVDRASAGGSYADRNARTDYLTLNHFVDVSEAAWGVTLSNGDSQFMRVGASTPDTLDVSRPSIFAVAGMQVDGPDLGFVNQGGDRDFLNRYALIAHGAYDPAAAMRASLEHQNPLVAAPLAPSSGASLPLRFGLLSVDSPDVIPWAVKPAEEGIDRGVIVRLWNLSDSARTFRLTTPGSTLRSAQRATHIETDTGAATVSAGALTESLARQQLQTWRLSLDGLVTSPFDAGAPLDAAVDVPRDTPAIDAAQPDVPRDAPDAAVVDTPAVMDAPSAMDAPLDAAPRDAPAIDAPPRDVERDIASTPDADRPETLVGQIVDSGPGTIVGVIVDASEEPPPPAPTTGCACHVGGYAGRERSSSAFAALAILSVASRRRRERGAARS